LADPSAKRGEDSMTKPTEPELDSPNFTPPGLAALKERGYKRVNNPKPTESHEERARLWSLGYGVGAGKEQLEALAAEFDAVAEESRLAHLEEVTADEEDAFARGYLAGLEKAADVAAAYHERYGEHTIAREIRAEIERCKGEGR
jgi:hypothetical protein